MSWELNQATQRQMYMPSTFSLFSVSFINLLCRKKCFCNFSFGAWRMLQHHFKTFISKQFSGTITDVFFRGGTSTSHSFPMSPSSRWSRDSNSSLFASSATRLLPPPRGVLWNIYTKCTWNPQPVLLEYGDLHLCNDRFLCTFLLFTSSSWSTRMVL